MNEEVMNKELHQVRRIVARETVGKFAGVLAKVPAQGGMQFIAESSTVPEYYNSAVSFAVGTTGVEHINRMFFGIVPSEDCGRERIFDLDVQKWTLENGEWYIHLLFNRSERRTAKHTLSFLPKGRSEDGDISLSYNGLNFLRVSDAETFCVTCGECGKRIYSSHAPNPKFARNAAEATATGKERYLCPDCLPREPRRPAPKPKSRFEQDVAELREAQFRGMKRPGR
ncbi:hypothetical protein HY932_03640 [Candidatus Falkowbacteria bacterium]|nr:hypothetical protein [Candidatus Falkowbacteria bacterium]